MRGARVRAAPFRTASGQSSRCLRPDRRRPPGRGAAGMRNVLIVAAREFRQIAAMRSFWLTLLILPIALGLGPLAARFLRNDDAARVMIVDRAGGTEARAIAARLEA